MQIGQVVVNPTREKWERGKQINKVLKQDERTDLIKHAPRRSIEATCADLSLVTSLISSSKSRGWSREAAGAARAAYVCRQSFALQLNGCFPLNQYSPSLKTLRVVCMCKCLHLYIRQVTCWKWPSWNKMICNYRHFCCMYATQTDSIWRWKGAQRSGRCFHFNQQLCFFVLWIIKSANRLPIQTGSHAGAC